MRCRGKKWNRPGNQDLGQKGGSGGWWGRRGVKQGIQKSNHGCLELPIIPPVLSKVSSIESLQSTWVKNWQMRELLGTHGLPRAARAQPVATFWAADLIATAVIRASANVQSRDLFAEQLSNTWRAEGAGGASQLTSCDYPSLHLAIGNLSLAVTDINLDLDIVSM